MLYSQDEGKIGTISILEKNISEDRFWL